MSSPLVGGEGAVQCRSRISFATKRQINSVKVCVLLSAKEQHDSTEVMSQQQRVLKRGTK